MSHLLRGLQLNCITYECRRPIFNVNANQPLQHELLMLLIAQSCVASVNAIIDGQALATQAQRSALAHFAIC